jgi:hypothetical protein
MSDEFYSLQTDDIKLVQGDTTNIEYDFVDAAGTAIDITTYDVKFTVRDPETGDVVSMLTGVTTVSKYHNDNLAGGRGVYLYGDTYAPSGSLTETNQLLIVLDPDDTSGMDYGVAYPFDIELSKYSGTLKLTAVRGHLLIAKEQTQ